MWMIRRAALTGEMVYLYLLMTTGVRSFKRDCAAGPMLQGMFETLCECERHGLLVHRKQRQRKTALTVAGPKPFIQDVLDSIFQKKTAAFDDFCLSDSADSRGFHRDGRFVCTPT